MRALGLTFVILGVLALTYGGTRFNQRGTPLDAAPTTATVTGAKGLPLAPVVGGIGLISGVALLAVPKKRTTPGWIEPNTTREPEPRRSRAARSSRESNNRSNPTGKAWPPAAERKQIRTP
jgi:hypothetical protein